MRKKLKNLDGQRLKFSAKVEKFGLKTAFRGPPLETVLFTNIKLAETGEPVSDHLWFTQGKWSHGLVAGDLITFEARVTDYVKGYLGHRDIDFAPPPSRDWKLERPTKVTFLERPNVDQQGANSTKTP